MNIRMSALLAGSSLLVLASISGVHAAPVAAQQLAAADDTGTEEIVVTARRKAESIEDVPSTVNAVTGAEFERLNILSLTDLDKVVSGLQLTNSGSFGSTVSTRGVTFNILQATTSPPTVGEYINEAPALANQVLQSIYDIQDVEVLKGPQGTARGIANPSGSITQTTKRADLERIGGYGDVTVTNKDAHNIQAGVSVPIVADKLGVRISGVEDQTNNGGIHSVNSGITPYSKTESFRTSIRFEPTDTIQSNFMYQHLIRHDVSVGGAVFGPGSPGGPDAAPGYNGPPITMAQYESVTDQPSVFKTDVDLVTGQINWAFKGQQLQYVGSYTRYENKNGGGGSADNSLPGFRTPQNPFFATSCCGIDDTYSQELRLASVDRIAKMFDYVVGAFYFHDSTVATSTQGGTMATGFFGPPGTTPSPFVYYPAFFVSQGVEAPRTHHETSFYANVTGHFLDDKLEVNGGVRRIASYVQTTTTFLTGAGIKINPALTTAATCAAAGGTFGENFGGFCTVPTAASARGLGAATYDHHPWVYSGTVSYHFTPDLMGYLSTASSWREGSFTVGITNLFNPPNSVLNALTNLQPETSKSYEAGAKWTFLDHRAHLNVDFYHQIYNGLIYTSPFGINYYTGLAALGTAAYSFQTNVPAKVDGFDVEFNGQVTKQWNVGGNFSWANAHINGKIPCNDSNFDGIPDTGIPPKNGSTFIAAGTPVAFCQSNASSQTAPKWNFNLNSEYDLAVNTTLDAFVRGLFTYQPKNPNANQVYVIPAYGLLNLYVGVRDASKKWELSLFGKNITGNSTLTSVGSNPDQNGVATAPLFGASTGYTQYSKVKPREFGVNLRYAFGSG